jgi:histone H3/H4
MFFSEACADRILKKVHSDITISGMGLIEINTKVIELFDRITRNVAPLVELNPPEVVIAIPLFLPKSLVQTAIDAANKAVADFTAAGKPIAKGPPNEFPLDDLLSRLREKFSAVLINGTAVVAMAAVLELCEEKLLAVAGTYCKNNRRAQIGRNDIRWAISNDDDLAKAFET